MKRSIAAALVSMLGVLAGIAFAAGVPQADVSASPLPAEPQHAWIVVPSADRRESAILHVPPRAGAAGARLGVAYIAARLVKVPARITGWGTRAFLISDPEGPPDARHRRVYTLNARYEGAWGWSYQPAGRLGVLPSLPPEGDLVSVVADRAGVTALLHDPADPAGAGVGRWSILRLEGVEASEWTALPAPWQTESGITPPLAGGAALVVVDDAPVLVALRPRGGAQVGLESWRLDASLWTASRAPASEPLSWSPDPRSILGLDGRILEIAREGAGGSRIAVNELWPRPRRAIAEFTTDPDEPGAGVGIGALDRGVLAVLWRSTPVGAKPETPASPIGFPGNGVVSARADAARFKIAELSTRTGRVLASGPLRQPSPLSDRPLHVVALLTGGFMAGLLIFSLRSDARPLPALLVPAGFGRRAAATITDLVGGIALASAVLQTTPSEMFTPSVVLGSVVDAAPVWLSLALAAVHSTFGELTLGGSIGKVVVGTRVGVLTSEPDGSLRIRRAAAGAILLRNLMKWSCPLGTVLAGFDPLRRGPADVVAGTIVVDLPNEPSAPEA
jgi:hypothetical protein